MSVRVSAPVWGKMPAIGELLSSENAGDKPSTQTPAAALLFQAPAFVEPTFQPPVQQKARQSEPRGREDAGSGDKGTTKRGQQGPQARPGGQPSRGKKRGGAQGSEGDDTSASGEVTAKSQDGKNKRGKGAKTAKGSGQVKRSARPADGPDGSQDSMQGDSKQSQGKQNQEATGKASGPQKGSPGQEAKDDSSAGEKEVPESSEPEASAGTMRRRRRRARPSSAQSGQSGDPADQVQAVKGSTRLEAKRMRRREGRRDSRRRQSITEAEFLARRESVDREMVVRHLDGADQVAVLEDGILVEHFVARRTTQSIVGNIYVGRVQNVLPSMEAAFVDIGRGRNAVLYAGEVNWDLLGTEGKPRRIETALKSGETVMVQVTKDPIGHKGARLTSQITLAGRYLVFVPGSSMLGISRKLPDAERARLKKLLRQIVPEDAGVIVRTAAEGATEEQLKADVERLTTQWASIQKKAETTRKAPVLLRGEPELVVRVVRDLFNEDFSKLTVQGDATWTKVHDYVEELSPELSDRLEHWTSSDDVFHAKKIQQQLSKGMDRKVWLPSGGTLVIERTEALTVVDVNTGKFVGSGGTLEETVTRNNLEAAEEIVRQLRLRDIGGIIIIDFVDMVLESNRELVLRRLVECLGRDRTRHQVTEITSLGLVQMTRKRVGEGLVEAFSTECDVCEGRGFIVHDHPVEPGQKSGGQRQGTRTSDRSGAPRRSDRRAKHADVGRSAGEARQGSDAGPQAESYVGDAKVRSALNSIAAASRNGAAQDEPPGRDADQTGRSGSMQSAPKSRTGQWSGSQSQNRESEPNRADKSTEADVKKNGSPAMSLEDIELPAKRDDEAPRETKARRSTTSSTRSRRPVRRMVTRAAGSPPSSTPTEGTPEAAQDAVRALLNE